MRPRPWTAKVARLRRRLGWLFRRQTPARVFASRRGAGDGNGTAHADETRHAALDRTGGRYELPFDFF